MPNALCLMPEGVVDVRAGATRPAELVAGWRAACGARRSATRRSLMAESVPAELA